MRASFIMSVLDNPPSAGGESITAADLGGRILVPFFFLCVVGALVPFFPRGCPADGLALSITGVCFLAFAFFFLSLWTVVHSSLVGWDEDDVNRGFETPPNPEAPFWLDCHRRLQPHRTVFFSAVVAAAVAVSHWLLAVVALFLFLTAWNRLL